MVEGFDALLRMAGEGLGPKRGLGEAPEGREQAILGVRTNATSLGGGGLGAEVTMRIGWQLTEPAVWTVNIV